MSEDEIKPQVVSESDVELVGPGHDHNHYISVPIKELFGIENVGDEKAEQEGGEDAAQPVSAICDRADHQQEES